MDENARHTEVVMEHDARMRGMIVLDCDGEADLDMRSVRSELDRRIISDAIIMSPKAPWIGPDNSPHKYKGFSPLSDQVLVRPLPAQDRISSTSLIVIPGNHDRGRLENKLGVVLAIGPGDPIAVKCDWCVSFIEFERAWVQCGKCHGTGFTGEVSRTSFEVQPGDTVLCAPRGWCDIELDGEKLAVLHDCQHILAIVDPGAVLFTEDPTTKKKAPDWAK